MEEKSTSLSAGLAVYAMLSADEAVSSAARKVFPIATDEAELPYIAYRRLSMAQDPVKHGWPGADTVRLQVSCFTASYAEGVRLAESVRRALDGKRYRKEGIDVRSCVLSDASENWQDDAFVQHLIFDIKV